MLGSFVFQVKYIIQQQISWLMYMYAILLKQINQKS